MDKNSFLIEFSVRKNNWINRKFGFLESSYRITTIEIREDEIGLLNKVKNAITNLNVKR